MLDLVADLLFRCPHRRLTRPITPVSKPGVPSGETYVVCLNCGKQFAYDWKAMRMGPPIETSPHKGVLSPDMPKPPNTKIKYALLGAALPLSFLFGKALLAKRRRPASAERKQPPGAGK